MCTLNESLRMYEKLRDSMRAGLVPEQKSEVPEAGEAAREAARGQRGSCSGSGRSDGSAGSTQRGLQRRTQPDERRRLAVDGHVDERSQRGQHDAHHIQLGRRRRAVRRQLLQSRRRAARRRRRRAARDRRVRAVRGGQRDGRRAADDVSAVVRQHTARRLPELHVEQLAHESAGELLVARRPQHRLAVERHALRGGAERPVRAEQRVQRHADGPRERGRERSYRRRGDCVERRARQPNAGVRHGERRLWTRRRQQRREWLLTERAARGRERLVSELSERAADRRPLGSRDGPRTRRAAHRAVRQRPHVALQRLTLIRFQVSRSVTLSMHVLLHVFTHLRFLLQLLILKH